MSWKVGELAKLPLAQLGQFKQVLNKFFYATGTNVHFWAANRNKKTIAFRNKVANAIKRQILDIAEVDKISKIINRTVKAEINNTTVAVTTLWLAFHESIIGGTEAIFLFLLWAGEQGGKTAMDKMIPANQQFSLKNLEIQNQLKNRMDFLTRVVDRTTIGWVATTINDAIKQGVTSPMEITKLLRASAQEIAMERADIITETELITAMNLVEDETYRRNGIKKHRWMTSRDERVDEACLENESRGAISIGQEFPAGATIPPQHILCRCYLLPVLPEFIEQQIWRGE